MTLDEFSGARPDADDRRAVLRECVEAALGPLAGRASATVDEVAALFGVARATAYEGVHAGTIPSLRIGRRVVVPVPGLAAALLGVQTNNGENATKPAPGTEAGPVHTDHGKQPDGLGHR